MSSIEFPNEKVFKHPLGTITLLNDTNFASWKADCEQVLHGIKAWRILMEEEVEPENPEGMTIAAIQGRKAYENFTTRKAQAGAIIYGSCSPEAKTHLNQVTDPVRMWQILTEQMDTAMTTVGRLTLFRQFSQLRPIPGQPIGAYFSRLLNISNQLAGTPEAIPDIVLKNQIFTTLPDMFKISVGNASRTETVFRLALLLYSFVEDMFTQEWGSKKGYLLFFLYFSSCSRYLFNILDLDLHHRVDILLTGYVLHLSAEHGGHLVSYIVRTRDTLLKPLGEESRV